MSAFLELRNLRTHFPIYRGLVIRRKIASVKAADGVSLSLKKGEILGLVGEYGCWKSSLARTVLQLVRCTDGEDRLEGRSMAHLTSREIRKSSMTFQTLFPY